MHPRSCATDPAFRPCSASSEDPEDPEDPEDLVARAPASRSVNRSRPTTAWRRPESLHGVDRRPRLRFSHRSRPVEG
jgi:hypothetical protein